MISLTDDNYLTEIEFGICDKFLCNYDGAQWLYKYNLRNKPLNFGERIYSDMGNALKIDVVETKLAQAEERKGVTDGVIIKWFKEDRTISLNVWEIIYYMTKLELQFETDVFSVDAILKNIDILAEKLNYKHDRDLMEREFNKRIILDYFLAQIDRTFTNVEFLIKNKEIKLAPCFDNGACLSFWKTKETSEAWLKEINKGEFIDLGAGRGYKLTKCESVIQTTVCLNNFYNSMMNMYTTDGDYKSFIKNIYNYDLSLNICQLEKENGKSQGSAHVELAQKLFEHRKKTFTDYAIKQQKQDYMTTK